MKALLTAVALLVGCAYVPPEIVNERAYAQHEAQKVGGITQLYLTGPVTSASASTLATQIIKAAENGERIVFIHIDSPGGSVYAGQALAKVMETSPLEIICRVDGMAASMAFAILQSCDTRLMTDRSTLMAHEPSLRLSGPATKNTLKQYYEELVVLGEALGRHMSRRLNITHEEFMRRIDGKDWFMDAKTALEVGAVDGVVPAVEFPRSK